MQSPRNDSIITVRGLAAGYGGQAILENLNFEISRGERFVILGGSGCGKSTLLKHLIGLLPPVKGTITVDGIDLTATDETTFRATLRRMGVLFQSGALIGSMTLAENVALPLKEFSGLSDEEIDLVVRMKLAMVHLNGFEHYLPGEISGGMKKRAGLARAMAMNPEILLFDEPSAGLDPITSAGLDELILNINQTLGTTMVIVTHELASIYTIAQRVIMLDAKSRGIVASGSPEQLRDHSEHPFVRNFFNRTAEPSAA